MCKSLLKDLRKYFPNDSIEELKEYLQHRSFRLHLVSKEKSENLSSLLSERSFKKLRIDGEVIESLEDLDFEVFHGSVIPGIKVKHIIDSNLVKEDTNVEPLFNSENLLIAKRSESSDLAKGYFNYQFINVYCIV